MLILSIKIQRIQYLLLLMTILKLLAKKSPQARGFLVFVNSQQTIHIIYLNILALLMAQLIPIKFRGYGIGKSNTILAVI